MADPQDLAGDVLIAHLKTYRLKAGLTQAELGRRAGAHPISVCHWETGKTKPYPSTAERIVAVFREMFPDGLPVLNQASGAGPSGSKRIICPHCGAPNHHYLEAPIPGFEIQCVSCSRTWRPFDGPAARPQAPKKAREGWHKGSRRGRPRKAFAGGYNVREK